MGGPRPAADRGGGKGGPTCGAGRARDGPPGRGRSRDGPPSGAAGRGAARRRVGGPRAAVRRVALAGRDGPRAARLGPIRSDRPVGARPPGAAGAAPRSWRGGDATDRRSGPPRGQGGRRRPGEPAVATIAPTPASRRSARGASGPTARPAAPGCATVRPGRPRRAGPKQPAPLRVVGERKAKAAAKPAPRAPAGGARRGAASGCRPTSRPRSVGSAADGPSTTSPASWRPGRVLGRSRPCGAADPPPAARRAPRRAERAGADRSRRVLDRQLPRGGQGARGRSSS